MNLYFKLYFIFTSILLAAFLGASTETRAQQQNTSAEAPKETMVQTTPPLSMNLIECSAIFDVLYRGGEDRGQPEYEVELLEEMADGFIAEAAFQAAEEGVADIENYVTSNFDRILPIWDGKYDAILTVDEYVKWVDYCRALARELDLMPEIEE